MKNTYAATLAIALSTLVAGQAMAAYSAPQGKTREQVRAELMEAVRSGDIAANKSYGDELGDGAGRKLNDLFPASYPAKAVAPGKTREQVRNELFEARRTGDIAGPKSFREEFAGTSGHNLNDLFPNQYPAKATVTGKTREQVRAEVIESQRNPAPYDFSKLI